MSNDLISREEAINRLIKCNLLGRKSCEQVAEMLKNLPTAYYVDKVVEQLDKASDYYECEEQGREHVQMVDLTEAIEIVRSGGVNG